MDIMYEIPSDESIEQCVITKGTVEEGSAPVTYRLRSSLASTILSRPSKAPPQIKRMLEVSMEISS